MRTSTLLLAGALLSSMACSSSNDGTSSTSTGASTNGGIIITNSGSSGGATGSTTGTTGAAITTGGASSGGTTGLGTSGAGTGTTTGSSTGTTSSSGGSTTGGSTGAGSSTTSGTTGSYLPGPPYQGFDGGPSFEPPIDVDAGCTATAPFQNPQGQYAYPRCVGCRKNSDCPSGQKCDSNNNYQCVACQSNSDCDPGSVCMNGCFYNNAPPYGEICYDQCVPDCRDAGADFCNPGLCDTDGGQCIPFQCTANSQCVVNGQGACNFQQQNFPNNYGSCAQCTQDAGGCTGDSLCVNQGGQSTCQPNCITNSWYCDAGSYCSDAGTCTNGCQSAADCTGSYSGNICHQGACVGCLSNQNCPDYNSGCGGTQNGYPATCGICASQSDCPSTLHCEYLGNYQGNTCACHSDQECLYDAPICLGLKPNLGFPSGSGRCACTDSLQCPSGFVCETRYPYTVTVNNQGGSVTGGACIPQCNLVGGTDCTTAGIQPSQYYYGTGNGYQPARVCEASTGYCVSCGQNADCNTAYGSTSSNPTTNPACVAFTNGTDPRSGLPTGGGLCGCNDTAQCNDGYACWTPGIDGQCQPPCYVTDGTDSCNPSTYYYGNVDAPFCNTFTGACTQCLDNYGCTNRKISNINGNYTEFPYPAPICTSGGQCVGCESSSDCPAATPNCTSGFCGYCVTDKDCVSGAGFSCIDFYNSGNGSCLINCVPDDNENPTDAGPACPTGLPYCTQTYAYTNAGQIFYNICASCRVDYYGDCGNNGYCQQNGTCYYYN